MIAGFSRQPHWFINDADAARYGKAMANAARHFPLRATQKALDVTMFIITAFSIEAPRIALSMQIARGHGPAHGQAQRVPAQVFQFINPNAPNAPASPPPAREGANMAFATGNGAPAPSPIPPSATVAGAPHDTSSGLDAIGGASRE